MISIVDNLLLTNLVDVGWFFLADECRIFPIGNEVVAFLILTQPFADVQVTVEINASS